jgi:hypothetical protein
MTERGTLRASMRTPSSPVRAVHGLRERENGRERKGERERNGEGEREGERE